jgi:hypothetical protein
MRRYVDRGNDVFRQHAPQCLAHRQCFAARDRRYAIQDTRLRLGDRQEADVQFILATGLVFDCLIMHVDISGFLLCPSRVPRERPSLSD